MSHDESMRLFKYMQGEFQKINLQFEGVNSRIDTLTNAVDACLKQNETYTQEMLALGHKVDRHEGWIHKVAKATDVRLQA